MTDSAEYLADTKAQLDGLTTHLDALHAAIASADHLAVASGLLKLINGSLDALELLPLDPTMRVALVSLRALTSIAEKQLP